jgi:ABC-2 type transport system permease protein
VRTLLKMCWLELKLFLREPITVLFALALPLLILYVLGGVFTDPAQPDEFRGVGGRNYYVPAYVGLVTASIGLIALPVHIAGYRERGVLRRFRASAVPSYSVFGAQVFVALVAATFSALVLIGAALMSWDISAPHSLVGVIVGFLLSVLCFAAIGFLLGALLPSPRAAQGVGVLLWFVMFMISGSGPPPEVMPNSLNTTADITPLKHVIVLIQDPWLGFGWNNNAFIVVLAILLVASLASARWLRWG